MSQAANASSTQAPRRGRQIAAIVSLLSCVLIITVSLFWLRNGLSPQDCELLEQLKNTAVGNLENGKLKNRPHRLPESDLLFQELARAVPGDPLPLRNLAITRLLYLSEVSAPTAKASAALKASAAAKARQAARALVDDDPNSAVAHLLAGKINALAGDEATAATEVSRAAELAPDDATVWYELFSLYHDSQSKEMREKAPGALGHAFRALPGNLFVQVGWLETQAETKDASIKQTVDALRSAWAHMPGLMSHVAQHSNGAIADPIAWLGRIASSAEQGDWRTAHRLAQQLANVVKPESWTRSDLGRLQRDPLEYVIHDFRTSCPKPAAPAPPRSSNVKLSQLPANAQPPALAEIKDIVLADFDLDERLDLIVLRDGAVEVYGSRGNRDWVQIVKVELPGEFQHLLAVDLDRDDPQQPGTHAHQQFQKRAENAVKGGAVSNPTKPCHRADLDLVVYGPSGIRFLRNEVNDDKTRSLSEVPQSPDLGEIAGVTAVAAADFYHDGDLDIALAAADGLHLWSNRGDLTFTDISGRSQLPADAAEINALVAVDWDHDIDLDLLAANASGKPAGYLENLRHGLFRWRMYEPGFDALSQAKTLALLDADALGSWKLAAAGAPGATLLHTAISRSGVASLKDSREISRTACDGLLAWDFDNDGNLDLMTWTGKSVNFFQGSERGDLSAIPPLLTASPQNIRACRKGDLDGDGDEELAVATAGRIVLYSNEGGNDLLWLDVELQAGVIGEQELSFRSNHYGLGSVIEVRSGTRIQRRVVEAAKTHFGLGQNTPDVLRVIWPTGVPQNLVLPDVDVVICDEQVLGGSCPYLYTWNGERFEFYTDCLWSAPLGLLLAEGQIAPSREWEYLRIDGDRLKARGGCYPLQITEELWEAVYLDEVRLIAVDHPADVEVYSNEKVGPAEIARHKVHTARNPRRPLAARDQQGRDILERIRQRDGQYVKAFDRRLAFGHTEDHYVELDFGHLDHPEQITLFLTGWIRPSGTSMNVAISQNPGLKPPAPPSLWVPDADGQWREARSYIGFPGGKTKTIAVDLSDVFLADDFRLRIATNMEIYWDEAFITEDEASVEVRQVPLELVDADLHYRGFSLRTPGHEYGPEHYDYERVTTEAKWPAMRGNFTRYGDVRELLTASDDLLVVLGAGDELTLRFSMPDAPPPPGWKRDFLLYNVGWDKDCDLNTVYGETVEPLPCGTLEGHPYSVDEQVRDAPKYQRYLRTYQTRTQDPVIFWQSD